MSRKKVTITIYARSSATSIGTWSAKLSSAGREKVLRGVINPGEPFQAQVFVNEQVLGALKAPCSVDCYQIDGPLKVALSQNRAQLGDTLNGLLGKHSVQWYWWIQEPGAPDYRELRRIAENNLTDFINALPHNAGATRTE